MSCASRFIVSHTKRRICRLTPFIVQYIFINSPIIYRYLYFYHRPIFLRVQLLFAYLSSKNFEATDFYSDQSNMNYFKNDADLFYLIQSISATTSAFLYATHIPERLWPGKFDIIGQSHQIFHLTAFVCTWSQFIALRRDMKHLVLEANFAHYKVDDEFYVVTEENVSLERARIPFTDIKLTYSLVIMLCIILNCLILVYYYFKAVYFNPWLSNNDNNGGGGDCDGDGSKCYSNGKYGGDHSSWCCSPMDEHREYREERKNCLGNDEIKKKKKKYY